MAVTQVVEQEAAAASTKSARSTRQPAAAWSTDAQLRKSWPMVRLLAEIWSIPSVSTIGVTVNGAGTYVHVFMPDDDREAESQIYAAERNYLNSTSLHSFDLMVTQTNRIPEGIRAGLLAGFDTVLER
jgi:hypothetical protein